MLKRRRGGGRRAYTTNYQRNINARDNLSKAKTRLKTGAKTGRRNYSLFLLKNTTIKKGTAIPDARSSNNKEVRTQCGANIRNLYRECSLAVQMSEKHN